MTLPEPRPDPLLSWVDLACMTRIGLRALANLRDRDPRFPTAILVGGMPRFRTSQVERWMESRRPAAE